MIKEITSPLPEKPDGCIKTVLPLPFSNLVAVSLRCTEDAPATASGGAHPLPHTARGVERAGSAMGGRWKEQRGGEGEI